jgi:HEAT repeats
MRWRIVTTVFVAWMLAAVGTYGQTTQPSPIDQAMLKLLRVGVPVVQPTFVVPSADSIDVYSAPEAAAATTRPPAPTTEPSRQQLQLLIEQLGDDDPHVRDIAVKALRKMGKVALPALREATQSADAQVKTSAEMLVAEQTMKPAAPSMASLPPESFPLQGGIIVRGGGIVMNNVRIGNIGGQVQVQMQVNHGQAVRDVTVNENGRKVHIHEDKDGVNVEVTNNGQTKQYKAATAAELKEKQPDGYKEYDRYLNEGVGRVIRVAPPAPR